MQVLNNGCTLLQIFLQLGDVLECVGGLAAFDGVWSSIVVGGHWTKIKPSENWQVVIPHLNIQISYRKYARDLINH